MIAWLNFAKVPLQNLEGAEFLDFCSPEKGGIFIVPRLRWHGIRFLQDDPKDRPIDSDWYNKLEILRTHPNPDPNRIYTNGQRVLIQLIILCVK